MSMFSKVIKDLFKPGKKSGKFPDPACKPPIPGNPPPVNSPDPFCTTGRKPRQTIVRAANKMTGKKGWD